MAATKIRTGQTTFTGGIDRVIPDSALTGLGSVEAISVKALKANAAVCEVGPSGFALGTGFELDANQGVSLDYLDPADIFVRGTAAQKICWIITEEA